MNLLKKPSLFVFSLVKKQVRFISHALNSITKSKKQNDSVFVRHANSQFNRACENYRVEHKIDYDWQALCKHPGFAEAVAYNPAYIDCPLTDVGVQQCYSTSHNLNLSKIDIILVSPHSRALQTCDNILRFSNILTKKKIPVVVEPLIAGSLWSSCDICKSVDQKMIEFNRFDFRKMMRLPQLWFIQNLRQQDKGKIYEQIKRRKLVSYKDRQLLVLQMIRTNEVEQSREVLRNRSWEIKKEMLRLKQNHCNILLISHYYIIQYINSKAFNEMSHTPVIDVDLKNCIPYYNNLQDILNYK